MTGALIGREAEAQAIEAVLHGAAARRPALLEVRGEPGIGKSRLLELVGDEARKRGATVLAARAAQFERDVPFAVFTEAVEPHLASQNLRSFEQLGAARLAELGALFAPLAELAGDAPPVLEVERFRSHAAVRALLELLAARRPLVVALDDLQWADPASLELIAHLARRPPAARVVICLAYRTAEAPRRLLDAIDEAARAGTLTTLAPAPLSVAEIAALTDTDANDPQLEWLARESGGNPFYVEQLRRTAPDATGAAVAGDFVMEAPAAVVRSLERELDALPTEPLALIEGAAVAGDPFRLEIAAAAAELEEPRALAALDELVKADLVRATAAARRFRFRHPIVRKAVYGSMRPGRRLAAHLRVRDALAAEGASPAEMGHHIEQSARPGDREAVRGLLAAGQAAAARAPATAAHWLRAALGLLDPDDPERLAILPALASSLLADGRLEDAEATAAETMAMLPADSPARAGAAMLCAWLRGTLGRAGDAERLLRSTLQSPPAQDPALRARIEIMLAALASFSNDFAGVRERAKRALTDAEAAGDLALRSAATSLVATSAMRLATPEEAGALTDRAAELIAAVPEEQAAGSLEAAMWLCANEFFLERAESSVRRSEWALALARGTGQSQLVPMLMMSKNWSLTWLGRLEESRAAWEEMLEVALTTGNVEFTAWAYAGLTEVATMLGDLALANDAAERARQVSRRSSGQQIGTYALTFAALARLESGDALGARDELLAAGGGVELDHVEPVFRAREWMYLTQAEIALGDLDAAEAHTVRAERNADAMRLPGRRAWARTARARVLLVRGRHAEAAEAALEAVALAETAKGAIYAGRARLIAGEAQGAAGDVEAATATLERARADFDRRGAARYADAAARTLRRLGHRVPRGGRAPGAATGTSELSRREREIAELVADGRKNREIAASLYLSEKTIEKHLSSIYAKLGVSGRGAVGARLASEQ